jgi:ankyrin repeat protein
MHAGETGHDSVMQMLRAAIGEPPLRYPPLPWAIKNDDDVPARLLERDCNNLIETSSDGQTPLSLATRMGRDTIVQRLLRCPYTDPDSRCMVGRTPLSWAAGNGHTTTVQILLEREVNLNSRSLSGLTPLLWAVRGGHENVTRLLLRQDGISVDMPDNLYGVTPLISAVQYGHEPIVRLLLDNGANIHWKNRRGRTPLAISTFMGFEVITQILESKIVILENPPT